MTSPLLCCEKDLQPPEVFRSQDDLLTAGEAWKAAMIDKGWQ